MWAFVVSLVLVVVLAMLVGNVFSQPLIMDKDISSEDSLNGTSQTFLPMTKTMSYILEWLRSRAINPVSSGLRPSRPHFVQFYNVYLSF